MISDETKTRWTAADTERFLPDRIKRVRPHWAYRLGLVGVAGLLLFLQASYLLMVSAASYGTYFYITKLPAIVGNMHINFLTILLVATPVVVGLIVTFFLFKPLLASRSKPAAQIQVDRVSDPVLFGFVDRLCAILAAPTPSRIEFNLQANASARFRRGWYSLHTNDLVLTIGLPLVSGLTVSQFAGVLAHEFGHFSQHAGMRLHFLIAAIRHWFARVAHERDKWDDKLDDLRQTSGWRTRTILGVAYVTVLTSRAVLRGLLHIATIVSAWFSRQMEFHADGWEAAMVGGPIFAETIGRLPVLSFSAHKAWQTLETTWLSRRLCDDFVQLVKWRDEIVAAGVREGLIKFTAAADRNASHPPDQERIARVMDVKGVLRPDVFLGSKEPRAEVLFSDFEGLCRKVTANHYEVSIGEKLQQAAFLPAVEFLDSVGVELERVEGAQLYFAPTTQPERWFLLPEAAPQGGELTVCVFEEDQSAEYRRILEESLNRRAALGFVRLGGNIKPESFQVSSTDVKTIEAEAAASRAALESEIASLRQRYAGVGHLLAKPGAFRDAYRAISAEQETLLELRHRLVTLSVIRKNLALLSAATAANGVEAHSQAVAECFDEIKGRLSKAQLPLSNVGTESKSLVDELLAGDSLLLSTEERARLLLDQCDWIAEQLLGALCLLP